MEDAMASERCEHQGMIRWKSRVNAASFNQQRCVWSWSSLPRTPGGDNDRLLFKWGVGYDAISEDLVATEVNARATWR